MYMIRVYNYHTDEVLERTFSDPADAYYYEVLLDFLEAGYERFLDGERLY